MLSRVMLDIHENNSHRKLPLYLQVFVPKPEEEPIDDYVH
jgi:hypothetical protein